MIAILSSFLGAACIFALANAEDVATPPKTSPDTVYPAPQPDGEEQSRGEPGTVEVPGAPEQSDQNTAWNPDQICKDRDGFIYREGQAGFDRCQSERGQAPGQAGQVAGETQSPTEDQTGAEDQPGVVEREGIRQQPSIEEADPAMEEPSTQEPIAPGNQNSPQPTQ